MKTFIQNMQNNKKILLKIIGISAVLGYFIAKYPQTTLSVFIFVLLLGILVFVHELGHFSVAKFFGIRVDEFGMGFPPRAKKLFHRNGTDYTLNWIPFGGFVKIHGEDALEQGKDDPDYHRSMPAKPWWQQILVLIAGVTMNMLLAWGLITIAFLGGTLASVSNVTHPERVKNPQLTVLSVIPGSPAEKMGIMIGDVITSFESLEQNFTGKTLTPENIVRTVRENEPNTPILLGIQRGNSDQENVLIIPEYGITGNQLALGVALDQVGIYRISFFQSIKSSAIYTLNLTKQTIHEFGKLFVGKSNLNNLTGPVGLVSVVGDAQQVGFTSVIMLAALISVNLAVINLVPFPALDGGRVVLVLIEAITRRKININIVTWINSIGFLLLIGLMILVTVKDIIKIF